jgi:hypothetical protein
MKSSLFWPNNQQPHVLSLKKVNRLFDRFFYYEKAEYPPTLLARRVATQIRSKKTKNIENDRDLLLQYFAAGASNILGLLKF